MQNQEETEDWEDSSESAGEEPAAKEVDVVELIKKLQRQITHLEEKLDRYFHSKQSEERPFHKKSFSRPRRDFGRSSFGGGFGHGEKKFHGGRRKSGFGKRDSFGGNFDRPFSEKKHSGFGGGFSRRKDRD